MDVRTRATQQGFTLVELVIAIIIIGILSVFASVQWSGITVNVGGQASGLQNDLRYTQALSMTQKTRYCLVITGSTYQIVNSATSAAAALANGGTTVTLASNVTFGTLVPASTRMFVFDGKGAPYSSTSSTCNTTNASGATALSSSGNIPLTGAGSTKTVVITPETGLVKIQ